MQVNTVLKKNNLFISLEGELDQNVAEKTKTELETVLATTAYRNVIFDMSKLAFMDSTGIGILLGRYKHLHKNHIPVYITAPNSQIDKIIRISGLYTIMPLL